MTCSSLASDCRDDAALEFEWRRNADEVDPSGGPDQRQELDRLRQILEMRTSGFVAHPNLLEFDLVTVDFWQNLRTILNYSNTPFLPLVCPQKCHLLTEFVFSHLRNHFFRIEPNKRLFFHYV